jgi:hypothetical protein
MVASGHRISLEDWSKVRVMETDGRVSQILETRWTGATIIPLTP